MGPGLVALGTRLGPSPLRLPSCPDRTLAEALVTPGDSRCSWTSPVLGACTSLTTLAQKPAGSWVLELGPGTALPAVSVGLCRAG